MPGIALNLNFYGVQTAFNNALNRDHFNDVTTLFIIPNSICQSQPLTMPGILSKKPETVVKHHWWLWVAWPVKPLRSSTSKAEVNQLDGGKKHSF